jgi:DNA-binding PucR family transcriptional regulator
VVKVLLGADPANLRRFAEEWLGPLIAYDRAHRADLVRTLAVYLEAGGNQANAAEVLFIHVSTLKYRVQRIREISGRDLSDPGVRFHLLLATKVLRALEVLGEAGAAPCPPGGTAPAGAGGAR